MSKARENRLWGWLSKHHKPHYRERLHMHRVENSCSKGMADVEGCLDGDQFWIELKSEARPSDPNRTKIKPKFQDGQPSWLKKRVKARGRAFVLLQVGSGHEAKRYLIPGDLAPSLAHGWLEEKLARLSVTPPEAKWNEVLEAAAHYQDL